MAVSFKAAHFSKEIILMGVWWYVAYPLSTRHVEESMEEGGNEGLTAAEQFYVLAA